jgi:uncharacterized membrane protein HdeD (DUF308 family)
MTTEQMPEKVINYAFLLGGLTAAIFGIFLLIRTEEAFGILAILLGLWWLIHGAFMVFSVFIEREDAGWKLAIGALGLAAGVVVLADPVGAAEFLGSTLAIILGVIGLLIALAAVWGYFRGGGIPSLVFGLVSGAIALLVILNPSESATVMVTLFSVLLLVEGVSGIYLALKLR